MRNDQLLEHARLIGQEVQRLLVWIIEAAYVRGVEGNRFPFKVHFWLEQVDRLEGDTQPTQAVIRVFPVEHRSELPRRLRASEHLRHYGLGRARAHHFRHPRQGLLYQGAQGPLVRRGRLRQCLEFLEGNLVGLKQKAAKQAPHAAMLPADLCRSGAHPPRLQHAVGRLWRQEIYKGMMLPIQVASSPGLIGKGVNVPLPSVAMA